MVQSCSAEGKSLRRGGAAIKGHAAFKFDEEVMGWGSLGVGEEGGVIWVLGKVEGRGVLFVILTQRGGLYFPSL